MNDYKILKESFRKEKKVLYDKLRELDKEQVKLKKIKKGKIIVT